MEKQRIIAKVNDQKIMVIENGEKLVPIKPICEALGIDAKVQRNKLNSDEILSSVRVLSTSTGNDGKQYEMVCLPFKYIFGWLFTINPKNVAPEAKESVLRYKMICYDVLYKHFTEKTEFLEDHQSDLDKHYRAVEIAESKVKAAKKELSEAKRRLDNVKTISFEEWKSKKALVELPFEKSHEETVGSTI